MIETVISSCGPSLRVVVGGEMDVDGIDGMMRVRIASWSPSEYQMSSRLNSRPGIARCAKHLASGLMYPSQPMIMGHTTRRRTLSRATMSLIATSSFDTTGLGATDDAMV